MLAMYLKVLICEKYILIYLLVNDMSRVCF